MSRIRALMPMMQSRVTVGPDGAIHGRDTAGWRSNHCLPKRGQAGLQRGQPDYIVFRENGQGASYELHAWGATYERVGWREQADISSGGRLAIVQHRVPRLPAGQRTS